jgi:hypothetical protein
MRITSAEMIFVVGIGLAIAVAFHVGLWFAARAVCRKFHLAKRAQLLVATTVCLVPAAAWAVSRIDRLDAHERTCFAETMKTPRMATARDVTIEKHFNFWTQTITGGGFGTIGWVSKPYTDAKVWLYLVYTRDHERYATTVECRFAKLPDTGNPPAIAFQSVDFQSERKRRVTP